MLPTPWTPSHRLTWTGPDGSAASAAVRVIRDAIDGVEVWHGQTQDDHRLARMPTWRYFPAKQRWTCARMPVDGVVMEPLSD